MAAGLRHFVNRRAQSARTAVCKQKVSQDEGRSDRSFVICTAHRSAYSCFFMARQPSWPGPHCLGFDITLRHTTLGSIPLDEGSVRRRDLYLTARNTHDRHACTGEIRPRNPGKRAAADPRPSLRDHWDWLEYWPLY